MTDSAGQDQTDGLREAVLRALDKASPLAVAGGGTKQFYGGAAFGEPLSTLGHTGIVDYEPTELVVTARTGTRLSDLEALLGAHGQMLAFEPPHYGEDSTVGGTVASGLSGPRRPYAGSVRDHVLGVRFINGLGEVLSMGGRVMKNVAGFDVSRLMAGSMGTLGLLLEVSLRVMPKPEAESTVVLECGFAEALTRMSTLATKCLPISAMGYVDGRLYVRVSGHEAAFGRASDDIGGAVLADAVRFWGDLKNQCLPCFQGKPLWRLSVAPATEQPDWLTPCCLDWGGALRWVVGDYRPDEVFGWASKAQGHATLFRNPSDETVVFQPLPPPLLRLNSRLKQAFDPHGLFQSRRLYSDD